MIGEGIEEASAPLKSGKTQGPHVEASWAVELADRLGRRSQQKRKQRFEGAVRWGRATLFVFDLDYSDGAEGWR